MAVWPQTDRIKILVEFKFGSGGPFIKQHCHLSLEAHKFTRNVTGSVLVLS